MQLPNFTLPDQSDVMHTAQQYLGSWLVVYTYPKDDTPGCTAQACQFRDLSEDFTKRGVKILGVSADSQKSHDAFATKYQLRFPLLADSQHTLIEQLGAWGPKKLFGKEFLGVKRDTFLINPQGKIVKEYKNVNPLTNPSAVLHDLDELMKS